MQVKILKEGVCVRETELEGSWEFNLPIPLSCCEPVTHISPLSKGMKGYLHLKATLKEKCTFKIPKA